VYNGAERSTEAANDMALAGLRPNEERTVRGVVEWARDRLGDRLVDIRLYGSKARGDSGPESDIDLFMLVTEKLSREEDDEYSEVSYDLDLENETVTMAVIRTVEQWSDPLRRATLFYKNVESEGVPL
jgi:predicted nucleotidyltransferase